MTLLLKILFRTRYSLALTLILFIITCVGILSGLDFPYSLLIAPPFMAFPIFGLFTIDNFFRERRDKA